MATRNDASRHHRQSMRLKGHDYSQPGAYFITICTRVRQCWFGDIKDDKLAPSLAGDIVPSTWQGLSERFPEVSLDAFVTMPNHVHGVIFIISSDVNVGAQFIAPDPGDQGVMNQGVMNHAPTLGECVRAFKAASTRLIRQAGVAEFGWQRNYYEHVVRNEAELDRIRGYIQDNPLRWELDEENPARIPYPTKRGRTQPPR